MVHNQSLTSSVSAELSESWQQSVAEGKIRRFEQLFGLPTTLPGFLLLSLAVLLVCAGMALLVLTSVQTFQTRQRITTLEQQLNAMERQNAELVWQIAQSTSLEGVRQRAIELGYDAPAIRHFVTVTSSQATANGPMSLAAEPSPLASPMLTSSDPWQWLSEQLNTIRSWW